MPNLRESREEWEKQNLSPLATRSNDERYASREIFEAPDPYRTSFQIDIGRILYSDAFRRLRTKTQVFTNPLDQHSRTRLTHSFEVSHIARQIARALRLNEDLTEAIALGHDLGHTPFGHAGERTLNEIFKDKPELGGFSHNVQSLWIVEKAYTKKIIDGKNVDGYNLTFAVREGILKHSEVKDQRNIEIVKKYDLNKPSTVEGQVVDIADGLAYLYHDAKDGQRKGLITEQEILDEWEKATGEFNREWFSILISDVIETSTGKNHINFSDTLEKAYKQLCDLLKEKVIHSDYVKRRDDKGSKLVSEMCELLINNQTLLDQRINQTKIGKYGINRTIIDYIQWLGDQNFEKNLDNLKERVS